MTQLVATEVSRLVDVRLNPISRKPGLSKTALERALTAAGIAYEHRRELGNPKTNRSGFAGDDTEWKQARSRYQELLRRPEAIEALDAVAKAASEERVAVLCSEADEHRCHRDLSQTLFLGALLRPAATAGRGGRDANTPPPRWFAAGCCQG